MLDCEKGERLAVCASVDVERDVYIPACARPHDMDG